MDGGVCFVNADVAGGGDSLRVAGYRIVAVDVRPEPGDQVVDLRGDRLLPGLINAHDHLQFNNYARTRFREHYQNVCEWIADVSAGRSRDASLRRAEALPIQSRLLAGAVKNLLSGATTVVHHDPFQEFFLGQQFPVRVLRAYGWAHSLAISGDDSVSHSHRNTPSGWPWFVHAGEGIDESAASEFKRLRDLGCIAANTLLVHGTGFDRDIQRQLVDAGAGVVWCPSSNLFLFGRTLDPALLLAAGRLALGSDSRLSGAMDLLDELRIASELLPGGAARLESLATRDNARLLRLQDRGTLTAGALADLLVIPAGRSLPEVSRSQLGMVMLAGRMRFGDAYYATSLPQRSSCVPVQLDGVSKVLDRRLVEDLSRSSWREPGLRLEPASGRAA